MMTSRDIAPVNCRQVRRVAGSTCAVMVGDSFNMSQVGESDAPLSCSSDRSNENARSVSHGRVSC